MSLPKIRLIYFAGRGRAEIARWTMAIGGIPYEDVRIKMDDWEAFKPKTLFGQVPMMEYGDVTLAQSHAINRLLAAKAGLAGDDDVQRARIEMIQEHIIDFWNLELYGVMIEDDVEKKKTMTEVIMKEKVPKYFDVLEKMLAAEGDRDYFVGGKLSQADLSVVELLMLLSDPTEPMRRNIVVFDESVGANESLLGKYPKMAKLVERVTEHPKLKAWLEKRPKNADEEF